MNPGLFAPRKLFEGEILSDRDQTTKTSAPGIDVYGLPPIVNGISQWKKVRLKEMSAGN